LKVGFVGVLSCLVLMLALFFSMGVASAQGTQAAVHSHMSVTSVNTLKGESKSPSQACKRVYVRPGSFYRGRLYRRGGFVRICQTCRRVYVRPGNFYRGRFYRRGGFVRVCRY